jgi:hypothetical protein
MKLTTAQAYRLLERHGIYALFACDKCGTILGAGRYTRRGDAGEWCSRACRGDSYAPGECHHCHATLPEGKRKGAAFCDDSCRKAGKRVHGLKLSRTKGPIYAPFRSVPDPGCYTPTMKGKTALERALA